MNRFFSRLIKPAAMVMLVGIMLSSCAPGAAPHKPPKPPTPKGAPKPPTP